MLHSSKRLTQLKEQGSRLPGSPALDLQNNPQKVSIREAKFGAEAQGCRPDLRGSTATLAGGPCGTEPESRTRSSAAPGPAPAPRILPGPTPRPQHAHPLTGIILDPNRMEAGVRPRPGRAEWPGGRGPGEAERGRGRAPGGRPVARQRRANPLGGAGRHRAPGPVPSPIPGTRRGFVSAFAAPSSSSSSETN